MKWEHYTKCIRMPMEILEGKQKIKNFLENKRLEQDIDKIMNDVNLLKLQTELREKGLLWTAVFNKLKTKKYKHTYTLEILIPMICNWLKKINLLLAQV